MTPKNILMGSLYSRHNFITLNYCILYAKWYIFKQKYLELKCFFLEYLSELKNKLTVERSIYVSQGKIEKFERIWGDINDNL